MSLGLAAALLTAGALADDLGHRRVLRCSAGLLAAASAAGALAPSMERLVAARVLPGVAGGGLLAAGLGSIGRTFPSGRARTHATAVRGAARRRRSHRRPTRWRGTRGGGRLAQWVLGRSGGSCGCDDGRGNADRVAHSRKGPA